MPIQDNWIRMRDKTLLKITPAEWLIANAEMQKEIELRRANGESPPFNFKIERKHIRKSTGEEVGVAGLEHSFVMMNDKLYALARGSKLYLDTTSNSEGILGHGGFKVCKLGQTADGEQIAITIEATSDKHVPAQLAVAEIMRELGELKGEFIKTRTAPSEWLYEQHIQNKEEPKIEKLLKKMLLSMTHNDPAFRPSIAELTIKLKEYFNKLLKHRHDAFMERMDFEIRWLSPDEKLKFFDKQFAEYSNKNLRYDSEFSKATNQQFYAWVVSTRDKIIQDQTASTGPKPSAKI